jgi:hypothetical protein
MGLNQPVNLGHRKRIMLFNSDICAIPYLLTWWFHCGSLYLCLTNSIDSMAVGMRFQQSEHGAGGQFTEGRLVVVIERSAAIEGRSPISEWCSKCFKYCLHVRYNTGQKRDEMFLWK